MPDDASVYGVTLPATAAACTRSASRSPPTARATEPTYQRVFVDPGTGEVNSVIDEAAGFT